MLHAMPVTDQILWVFAASCFALLFAVRERKRVLGATVIYALGIALQWLSDLASRNELTSTGKTLAFLALVLIGIALINLAAIILFDVVLRWLRLEVPRILRDLLIAFGYIALLLFLFSQYRVDLTGIIATSAVITAVIGFSLQDVLQNVMGGIALQLDRTFAVGQWIAFGDVNGIVREISWRRTMIETRNGDLVAIPNSQIMKNQVRVLGQLWSGDIRERRIINFQVGYQHSPAAVIEAVEDALNREAIPRVAREPRPHVVLMDFRDGVAHYAARYWLTDLAVDDPTDSLVRTRLFYALQRAGISLAVPPAAVAVHRSAREPQSVEPPLEARTNALKSVPIFASLKESELERVAKKLIYAPFLPGEAIILQGHAVHHLYILTSGVVEVRVSVDGGAASSVAKMRAPNFFGEGGMLTGEPRSATIIALTEVECWRLDKDGFEEIIHARPEIAEEISHVVAMRRVELAAVKENLSEEAMRHRFQAEHSRFLGRIREFFGLGS